LTEIDPPIGDVAGGPGVHAGAEPNQPCGRATRRAALDALAAALQEREVMDREQVGSLLAK